MTEHHVDYLIIGGGIAGTTAAEAIRAHDLDGRIAIISKEPYELYSRVLLPKYIEGAIAREQVFLRKPDDYYKRNISLFIGEEATVVDGERKEVRTRNGTLFFYKQLLISAGGRVRPWRAEGSDAVPVSRLQTIDDADKLREQLGGITPREVLIVGAGFITLELLSALVPRRISARILMPEQRYWEKYLDEKGSAFLETFLERTQSVSLQRGESITFLRPKKEGNGSIVYTSHGNEFEAGTVAVGMGLQREIEPFTGIGIEVDRGLKSNEFLETAVNDIWVAGDIAEQFHPVFQKHMLIGNWNNAFLQGRTAGINMAMRQLKSGSEQRHSTIPLYAIDVAGLHIAFIGDVFPNGEEAQGRSYVARFQNDIFYERFSIEDGRLVGAVLMNKFEDRRVVERLIREKVDVAPYLSIFSDSMADLAEQIV